LLLRGVRKTYAVFEMITTGLQRRVMFSTHAMKLVLAFLFLLAACTTARQRVSLPSEYAVASWYGPEFQGRPTSSGESFDMYKKTCAHREYAFGTKVRVTNPANGKTVECIVNDRGPFVEGRDLDLSYAAAREIGLVGPGTARVRIEREGRDGSYIRNVVVQTKSLSGPFAIQVGSFADGVNAIRLEAALNLRYQNVYVEETELQGTGYYRVRVGNFEEVGEALAVARKLGQEGYRPIVVKAYREGRRRQKE
jgi:rare lipoprotein A